MEDPQCLLADPLLPRGHDFVDAYSYFTPVCDMSQYLPWLEGQMLAKGGRLVEEHVSSLDQAKKFGHSNSKREKRERIESVFVFSHLDVLNHTCTWCGPIRTQGGKSIARVRNFHHDADRFVMLACLFQVRQSGGQLHWVGFQAAVQRPDRLWRPRSVNVCTCACVCVCGGGYMVCVCTWRIENFCKNIFCFYFLMEVFIEVTRGLADNCNRHRDLSPIPRRSCACAMPQGACRAVGLG